MAGLDIRTFDSLVEYYQEISVIRGRLSEALRMHFDNCPNQPPYDDQAVKEILYSAGCEAYDALAKSFMIPLGGSRVDHEQLFSIAGELHGGVSNVNFCKACECLVVEKPQHWEHIDLVVFEDRKSGIANLMPYISRAELGARIATRRKHWRGIFEHCVA